MGVLLTRKLLAAVTIITMIGCGFVFANSGSCITSTSDSGAGLACSAENIGAQTVWTISGTHVAVQTKELLIVALVGLMGALLVSLRPIKREPILSVWNLRKSLIPNHTFIPHLSASHGG
jgi:hypothetical protein